MTAGKETATPVQLGDPAAAVHAVDQHTAKEPRSLTTKAARRPPDRHELFNRLPFVVPSDHPAATEAGQRA